MGSETCFGSLMSSTRSIWASSRLSRRKLPSVIWTIRATILWGKRFARKGEPRRCPALAEQFLNLGLAERAKLMDETDAGVELRIPGQALPGMPISTIRQITKALEVDAVGPDVAGTNLVHEQQIELFK